MKPQLSIPALVMCTILFVLNHTNAQEIAMNKSTVGNTVVLKEMKEPGVSTETESYSLNNISMSAKRDFMHKYKEVNNASWCEIKRGYEARFTANGVTTTVTYKKNGEWLHTVSNYGEQRMPQDVRALVKSTYYDYCIIGIQQIRVPQNDNDIYLIRIQDTKSMKVLRVCDGEMQVLYDYIRS